MRIGVFSFAGNAEISGAKLIFTDSTGNRAGKYSVITGKFNAVVSGKYKVEIEKEGYEKRSKEFEVKCDFADDDAVFSESVYMGDAEKGLPAPEIKDGMGILKGVALYLPKPKYPVAMLGRKKVSSTVWVTVTIDEDGNVISGAAENEDSLLGEAAVNAAMGAKFQPTRLSSGAPVNVMGRISYNFVP